MRRAILLIPKLGGPTEHNYFLNHYHFTSASILYIIDELDSQVGTFPFKRGGLTPLGDISLTTQGRKALIYIICQAFK